MISSFGPADVHRHGHSLSNGRHSEIPSELTPDAAASGVLNPFHVGSRSAPSFSSRSLSRQPL